MSPHLLIALITSAAMLLLAVVAVVPTYRVAPLFLLPLLWAVYLLRHRLRLPPFHYALFASALLLHNLGAFGWYQRWPLDFSFDILVHFYFAFVAAFIVFRIIQAGIPALRPWQTYAATFLVIMGTGAVHEIMEYISWLLLGDKGMLKTNGYIFDTQRDLLNNFLGVCVALTCIATVRCLKRAAPKIERSPEFASPQPARATARP
jgi:uncharacterized membrane protein YjdF